MANANLEKIDLIEVETYQNGERANADNLNRPVNQIITNITNQKAVLDSVIDVLSSDDISLDELQEVATFIKDNREMLNDVNSIVENGGKLRLDNRLSQTNIIDVTYNDDGFELITYETIDIFNADTNEVQPLDFTSYYEYEDGKLIKVYYRFNDYINTTESIVVDEDKIIVSNSINEVLSISFDGEEYTGTYTIDDKTITLEDNSQDGLTADVEYKYIEIIEYANNEIIYKDDNPVSVKWTYIEGDE